MAKYTVLQPVSYIRDGAAVHQTAREVGTVIDVDDAQARPLVEAGALERHKPAVVADDEPATGRRSGQKADDGESA